jgi:hypothetical protein
MESSSRLEDVAAYAAAVRSALASLKPAERDVLLEDLDDHLAEVAADAEGSLEDRLGPPEQYANELISAYGVRPAGDRRRTPGEKLRQASAWLTATSFYRGVEAFLPQLRPAWWVLRGYLAVLIITALFSPGYLVGPLPNLSAKRGLAELVLMGAAVWLSVRIGQRRQSSTGLLSWATFTANGLIAIVGLAVLSGLARGATIQFVDAGPVTQSLSSGNAFGSGQVTNIYPYSTDGKPLTNVLLFDQDGHPVTMPQAGDPVSQFPNGADGQPITNAYPLKQHHADGSPLVAPRVAIPPWPSPTPSASINPTATPIPSATH